MNEEQQVRVGEELRETLGTVVRQKGELDSLIEEGR